MQKSGLKNAEVAMQHIRVSLHFVTGKKAIYCFYRGKKQEFLINFAKTIFLELLSISAKVVFNVYKAPF